MVSARYLNIGVITVLLLIMVESAGCALSNEDKMPDLLGKTYYGELENRLNTNNFSVTLTVSGTLIPESSGIVISQTPAAGENLPEADENGRVAIDLTVSPIVVEVPDVSGIAYSEAKTKLYSLGLTSARLIKISQYEAGLVLDQFPAAKTNVAIGTKITLTVAQALPLSEEDDGCAWAGQTCICSATGWRRYCNYGPHRQGLYCQCD